MGKEMSATNKAGRMLRLMGWIMLLLTSAISASVLIPSIVQDQPIDVASWALIGAVVLFSVLYLIVGARVKRHDRWAKIAGVILSAVALLNIPFGTVIGGFALYYFFRGWNDATPTI